MPDITRQTPKQTNPQTQSNSFRWYGPVRVALKQHYRWYGPVRVKQDNPNPQNQARVS